MEELPKGKWFWAPKVSRSEQSLTPEPSRAVSAVYLDGRTQEQVHGPSKVVYFLGLLQVGGSVSMTFGIGPTVRREEECKWLG